MGPIRTVRAGRGGPGRPPPDPPTDEIPGFAMPEHVLTRSDVVVVSVGPVEVYSTSVLVTFHARFDPNLAESDDDRTAELHRQLRLGRRDETPPMTLGVRYADGSSRSTTALPETNARTIIYIDAVHSGGNAKLWYFTFWLWPPTSEDMTFFAEWPEREVPHAEAVLTSSELATARSAVQHLDWPAPGARDA